MKPVYRLLFKTLIKSFYRENAGVFVFFFVVFFGVVQEISGTGLLYYHYSLITGMLQNFVFFVIVLIAWTLYYRKCIAYISEKIKEPKHEFLQVLLQLNDTRLSNLILFAVAGLFFPVLFYSIAAIGVALYQQEFGYALTVCLFNLIITYFGIFTIKRCLYNREISYSLPYASSLLLNLKSTYPGILAGYLFSECKTIMIGIKLFTCGILYLLALNNQQGNYDIQLPFLFFSFGLFANSIIIHRLRNFEEDYLSYYRGLSVNLFNRFILYILLYLVYFIPEFITIFLLADMHLHQRDALYYIVSGYSILLLLHCISLISYFSMKVYLRISLLLFAIVYIFVLSGALNVLGVSLLLLSTIIFFSCYYRYEHVREP